MDKVKSDSKSSTEFSATANISQSATASASAAANANLILDRNAKIAFMKMRKKIIEFFNYNKYDDLKNLLIIHKHDLETFFLIEGSIILNWAVIQSEDNKALLFLCHNIPQDLLQKALKKDAYYIIKTFLQIESASEGSEFDIPQRQELQREKFKLLLSIDPKNVSEFMEKNASQEFSTAKIKLNFARIVSENKEQNNKPN
jgi:hypothetical protein